MANIIRHGNQPRAEMLRQSSMDPLRVFRDLLRWDPFAEMVAAPLEQHFSPDFEIKESDDAYVFKADLPGVKLDDLDIAINGNRLTVSGTREAETRNDNDRFYAYERTFGSFSRSFTLPEAIDVDRANAALDNGVLTITMPRRPEAQPKKIAVGQATKAPAQVKEKPKA